MRICITGPESTGKTTLTKLLAEHFNGGYVEEYARKYFEEKGSYEEGDLLAIAKRQKSLIESNRESLVFCDTGVEVIQVWSEWKYGKCDPWILRQVANNFFEHYLLCSPDLPWEQDGMRENPNDRHLLFAKYLDIMKEHQRSYTVVSGQGDARNASAFAAVESFLQKKDRRN